MNLDHVVVRRSDTGFEVLTPRAALPTIGGGMTLLLVGMAMLLSGDPVLFAMGGAMSAFAGLWLRELHRSGVQVTSRGIVERGDLRRRRWDLDNVERFFVDRTPHFIPWYWLWLELGGSRRQPLQVRVLGRGREGLGQLERAADEANNWLTALRAGGSTGGT